MDYIVYGVAKSQKWLSHFHYAEYILRNAGLDEAQVGIKTSGRKSITSDM